MNNKRELIAMHPVAIVSPQLKHDVTTYQTVGCVMVYREMEGAYLDVFRHISYVIKINGQEIELGTTGEVVLVAKFYQSMVFWEYNKIPFKDLYKISFINKDFVFTGEEDYDQKMIIEDPKGYCPECSPHPCGCCLDELKENSNLPESIPVDEEYLPTNQTVIEEILSVPEDEIELSDDEMSAEEEAFYDANYSEQV